MILDIDKETEQQMEAAWASAAATTVACIVSLSIAFKSNKPKVFVGCGFNKGTETHSMFVKEDAIVIHIANLSQVEMNVSSIYFSPILLGIMQATRVYYLKNIESEGLSPIVIDKTGRSFYVTKEIIIKKMKNDGSRVEKNILKWPFICVYVKMANGEIYSRIINQESRRFLKSAMDC